MAQEINATIRGKQSNVPYEKKTVVLGGNMVGERNILTQDMLLSEDTKYIIRWAFDLDAKTVIMPAGSSLEFNGGSINNGTIVLNDTPVYPSYNMLTSGSHLTVEGNPSVGTYNYTDGMPVWWNGTAWVDAKGFTATHTRGTTRPTGVGGGGVLVPSRDIGFEFFDTNPGIMKPIYASAIAADGTVTWVDATGATV